MLNVCCTVAHHKYVGLLVHVFKLRLVTQLSLCKESNGVCVFQSINVFISDNRDQSVPKCKFECIYVSERANLFVTDRARLHMIQILNRHNPGSAQVHRPIYIRSC